MARHLVATLLSELDADRSRKASLGQTFVHTSSALWPDFYSQRRVRQLAAYVDGSLTAYVEGTIDHDNVSVRLTHLMDMAASRDSRLIYMISSAA